GEDSGRLARWEPECVAGLLDQIERCAVAPTHAVVVFSGPGNALSAAQRDGLWSRFGVPVFEQMVDERGNLLAAECEGHDGLHLLCDLEAAPPGVLRRGVCACGVETVRLFPVADAAD